MIYRPTSEHLFSHPNSNTRSTCSHLLTVFLFSDLALHAVEREDQRLALGVVVRGEAAHEHAVAHLGCFCPGLKKKAKHIKKHHKMDKQKHENKRFS